MRTVSQKVTLSWYNDFIITTLKVFYFVSRNRMFYVSKMTEMDNYEKN